MIKMNKISVKKKQFSQNSLEPKTTSSFSQNFQILPDQKFQEKSSFNSELKKITAKVGPVLEKNILKVQNVSKDEKGLPFKRRARSSSPPKEDLKVLSHKFNLFPCGAPVVPVDLHAENRILYVEDEELRRIKEDYLKLLESAQDTKATENEDYWDEEEAYIENIIHSLSFVRLKQG
jgi:hypothetical protein